MSDCTNTHFNFPETENISLHTNIRFINTKIIFKINKKLEKHKPVVFHQSMKSILRDLLNSTAEYNLLWLIMWNKD